MAARSQGQPWLLTGNMGKGGPSPCGGCVSGSLQQIMGTGSRELSAVREEREARDTSVLPLTLFHVDVARILRLEERSPYPGGSWGRVDGASRGWP